MSATKEHTNGLRLAMVMEGIRNAALHLLPILTYAKIKTHQIEVENNGKWQACISYKGYDMYVGQAIFTVYTDQRTKVDLSGDVPDDILNIIIGCDTVLRSIITDIRVNAEAPNRTAVLSAYVYGGLEMLHEDGIPDALCCDRKFTIDVTEYPLSVKYTCDRYSLQCVKYESGECITKWTSGITDLRCISPHDHLEALEVIFAHFGSILKDD